MRGTIKDFLLRLFSKAIFMQKTLHKVFTKSALKSHANAMETEALISSLPSNPDMRAVLKEASEDLLQPRPEAVAALLKKIRLS